MPPGYAGPASDDGAGLVANAGQYNFELADVASFGGRRQSLLNAPTVKSVNATVRRELTSWLDAYVELAISENRGETDRGLAGSFRLDADTPGNPFQQTITVTTPIMGVDSVVDSLLESDRAAAGIIASLPGNWRAQADYTWNRTRFSFLQPSFQIDKPLSDVMLRASYGTGFLPASVAQIVPAPEPSCYDFSVGYQRASERFGQWMLSTAATHYVHNQTQAVTLAPIEENTGTITGLPSRGHATLSWSYKNWNAAWTARYFDSYRLFRPGQELADGVAAQGSPTVRSQTYHDVFASFRFDSQTRLLAGTEIQLGINNVFNTRPAIDVMQGLFYSTLGDPRLASYYVSLRKAF